MGYYSTRGAAALLRESGLPNVSEQALHGLLRRGLIAEPLRIPGGRTYLWPAALVEQARAVLEKRRPSTPA